MCKLSWLLLGWPTPHMGVAGLSSVCSTSDPTPCQSAWEGWWPQGLGPSLPSAGWCSCEPADGISVSPCPSAFQINRQLELPPVWIQHSWLIWGPHFDPSIPHFLESSTACFSEGLRLHFTKYCTIQFSHHNGVQGQSAALILDVHTASSHCQVLSCFLIEGKNSVI